MKGIHYVASSQQDPSTEDKTVFSSIQPDASSAIPQANKGWSHRRRAIVIGVIIIVVLVAAFVGYFVVALNEQSV